MGKAMWACVCAVGAAVAVWPAGTVRAEVSRADVVVVDATSFLGTLSPGDTGGIARGGGGRGGNRGGRGGRAGRGGAASAPAAAGDQTNETPVPVPVPVPAPAAAAYNFENYAINLGDPTPVTAEVKVATAGKYTLWVRSKGTADSGFHVVVNGKASTEMFGNAAAGLKNGGTFDLPAGKATVVLQDIKPGASMDVIVLSKAAGDLTDADLKGLEYPAEMVLLKDYPVVRPDGVKFGDLNGDGKTDFVVLTRNYSCYAYDNSGKELWHYDAPEEGTVDRSQFEAPGVVWDFDHDGKAEVVHYRQVEGKEYLTMSDGMTGEIKHQVPWPCPPLPHVYNNFRLAVAKLHPGYADDLIVYTDPGGEVSVSAYGPDLKLLWSYSHPRLKDYHGHYIYPVDLNGTGVDDVYVSHVMLNPQGKEVWNNYDLFPDNHDHVDSARFVDLYGDGKLELVTGQSDVGTVLYDAYTGALQWQRFSNHTQKIEAGNYLASGPQPQIVANSRYYPLAAQVRYFDVKGNRLGVWPSVPIPGNPNFVKGDWKGDGHIQLFWQRYMLTDDGKGVIGFPDEVFHMFDFMHTGNDQVITLGTDHLRVYGFKGAAEHKPNLDPDYWYKHVANHTHY